MNPLQKMSDHHFRFSLDCPLPKLDFDRITLGHGSGGLLTNRLLDEGVFKRFKNDHIQKRHDGVVLQGLHGSLAFTTDSFVVSPLFFPGGNIGDLAVNGTVNDLLMCGAQPRYLSLAMILEEGLMMEDYWEILLSIEHAAAAAGVEVVTGDTKVVDKGKGDLMFINTSGIGTVVKGASIDYQRIEIGDVLVVSNSIAHHGMTIMMQREGLQFDTTMRSDSRPLYKPVLAMLEAFQGDVKLLRDPTRGGVATVLNEIAGQLKVGVKLDAEAVPVDDVVRAACEVLGIDPLYVANEGVFIAVVRADVAEDLLTLLRGFEESAHAQVIGSIVNEHPGKVVMQSGLGGRRVVNMLAGEQLPRIC